MSLNIKRFTLLLLFNALFLMNFSWAEESQKEKAPTFSFSGSAMIVNKYIARGWRLTDGPSFQPSGTLSFLGFSLNVWGTMDLTAVNEGDVLLLPQNPGARLGDYAGLKGRFSETDFTFSYAREVQKVSLSGGVKSYVYPERAKLFPSSTEIFGGATFVSLPLKPRATLYVDVDETADLGKNGLYLELAAQQSIKIPNRRISSLDLSGTFAFSNTGFAKYYYGTSISPDHHTLHGPHDFNLTATLPCKLSNAVSVSFVGAVSGLMGAHRTVQYPNLKDVYLHQADTPNSRATTLWGGVILSLAF